MRRAKKMMASMMPLMLYGVLKDDLDIVLKKDFKKLLDSP